MSNAGEHLLWGAGALPALILWLMRVLQHLVAFALLILLSIRLGANLRFLRFARRLSAHSPRHFPRVSVLVPARNESGTISACATSLLEQDYPDFEVLVFDDGSTDGTGEQLEALRACYPQLVILSRTEEPPPGWTGKSYACARLAELASGDWLLFTDSDTLHAPQSIKQGVAQAIALRAALLSAFPFQRVKTWSERVLVSFLLDFLPLVAISLNALWRGGAVGSGKRGRDAGAEGIQGRVVANGQYLLAHAPTYRAVGGHASIRSALLDDFALVQRFQACGYTVAMVDGVQLLSCRMYHSVAEVWQGFSKNLLGALTMQPTATETTTISAMATSAPPATARKRIFWGTYWKAPVFAWCYACLFALPFFNVFFSGQKALAGVEICWLLLLRGVAGWRFRRPLDEILTTPLAAWGVMAIGLGALYGRWRGRRIVWKGRLY